MSASTMKLGTETGSIVNALYSSSKTKPEVGKGMTRLSWTDRQAYEVVFVSGDGKRIVVQEYDYKIKNVYDGYGELKELLPYKTELRYRYGAWWQMGEYENVKWKVIFGVKETYIDPHF